MRAGRLRDLIIIKQKGTVTRDASGGELYSKTTFATLPAEVLPLKTKDYIAAKAAQVDVVIEVNIRYYPGITNNMWVSWGGADYPIDSVINVRGRNTEIQLLCSGPSQPS